MALTAAQLADAKAEAREYLEYSIQVLALTLGASVADLSSSMTNPLDAENVDHDAFASLIAQVEALEAL